MATDPQSIIDAIDAAILRIAQYGAAVGMDGGTLTEANLPELLEAKATAKRELAAASINASDKRPIKVFGIRMGRAE